MSEFASYSSCPAWPKVFESAEMPLSYGLASGTGRLPEAPVLP